MISFEKWIYVFFVQIFLNYFLSLRNICRWSSWYHLVRIQNTKNSQYDTKGSIIFDDRSNNDVERINIISYRFIRCCWFQLWKWYFFGANLNVSYFKIYTTQKNQVVTRNNKMRERDTIIEIEKEYSVPLKENRESWSNFMRWLLIDYFFDG